ncbi:MULE transposase [Hirsutella rhossiliensis]
MLLLPPPSDMPLFSRLEDAVSAIELHARVQGYAVIKYKPSNYRGGKPRRLDLVCACGGRGYVTSSAGLRRAGSRKTNCPFAAKIVQRQLDGDQWRVIVINPDHNHDPSPPGAFPEYRRLSDPQVKHVEMLAADAGVTARQILLSLRAASRSRVLATEQDIMNIIARLHRHRLGAHTSTQALIALLDREGVYHKERLDDENRFKYQFIGLDEDLELWSQHSHLMMADVTNNTNQYGLKLLEINGITSLGTVFPVAFCLVPREDTPAFTWCFEQLREWVTAKAEEHGRPRDTFIPYVVITDYDSAARAALAATFPIAQLQVCTWHIMKNVSTYARRHWQGDNDDPFEAESRREHGHDPGRWSSCPGKSGPGEFVTAFKSLLYAPDEAEFDKRWDALTLGFTDQPRLVKYLEDTWLHVRRRFLCRS